MKCAIMQPTFLPWIGYFDLIDQVDTFVFFDDVQLTRRSWQVRNRILSNGNEALISLPIVKSPQSTKIYEAQLLIDDTWINKFINTLNHSYAKAPYKNDILDILSVDTLKKHENLADMNIEIIEQITRLLNLDVTFKRSKDIPSAGFRSDKLHNICQHLRCDTYVSPPGSKEYLEQDGVFDNSNITLKYNEHTPIAYPQTGTKEFIPYMSVIDLIANVGYQNSLDYIRGAR